MKTEQMTNLKICQNDAPQFFGLLDHVGFEDG